MLTWQQFFEAKEKDLEKEEEKLGKDLDGDNEEGESAEHKEKVMGSCPVCKKKGCECICKDCKMSKKKCKC